MLKRLLVVGQLPPPHHGSNVMARVFLDSLREIGYDVSFVEKPFSKQLSDVGKSSVGKLLKIPLIASRIIYRIVEEKPEICFFFNAVRSPTFFVDALLLFTMNLLGQRYVLYVHGLGLLALTNKLGMLTRFVVGRTLGNAIGAIVLSRSLEADLDWCISSDRLFVLPNGIPDIDLTEKILNRRHGKPVQVLFLSNLIPSKGPMEFLQMAKKVLGKFENVKFVLAGPVVSPTFLQHLRDYIEKVELTDVVEITGGLYGADKEKYFRESDIFVFPTHREAFPLVILEAMEWGLPVISSKQGAIPEIVRDGINGCIVDAKNIEQLAERTLYLIRNEEIRERMGKESRRAYESAYSLEAYKRKLRVAVDFFLNVGR
jgi:glycosyltransferase involved in cell wall biosynthesis